MGHLHLHCAQIRCSYLLVAALLMLCFGGVVSTINDTDRLALLAFKAKINSDPFGSLNLWNNSINVCRWNGVQCGRRHYKVTVLDLHYQGLSGPISPHIGNLSFLRELRLENNRFGLDIPPQIGQLRRLRVLLLFNNSLTGEIPRNISGCSNLMLLRLGHNQLVGGIPVELGSLSNLQAVDFVANLLTGNIPSSIGNMSSLEQIYCFQNGLSGIIPQSLGRLTKLIVLSLGVNWLSGTIPPSVFNLSSLERIEVGLNQIHGNLPEDIGFTLPNLNVLTIALNQFSGSIPLSISNATNLGVLQFGGNEISGKVPSLANLRNLWLVTLHYNYLGSGGFDADELSFLCSLTNATNLVTLRMHGNRFGGTLPVCIGDFSKNLTILQVGQNLISGVIPREIGNLVNMQRLDMQDNLLSGPIPSDLGNLSNLAKVFLSGNNLSGIIPSSLQNLQSLLILNLASNNFEGSIPMYLRRYQYLMQLDLSSNNLSGPVIFPIAGSLIYLNLSPNHLSGVLPMEIGNLKHLDQLDVSGNSLDNEIPSSLSICDALTVLRMQDNLFHGPIPQSISSLKSIEELDLSTNNFHGEIPKFLGAFQFLEKLNLSFNHLEGPLPIEGVFRNVSATFVIGNENLCGGVPEFKLPDCTSRNSKSRGVHELKLVSAIVFGLLGIPLVLTFLYLCRWKKKSNEPISSSLNDSLLNLPYGTLLKATQGFSSTNLIGVGSFGSVYKGLLQANENVIAIKVLNLTRHGALNSFKIECEVSKHIKHRNLVKVLTACSSIDYNGDEFKALVYEFMVNGSLEKWLHPNPAPNDANGHSRKLSLTQRINISIDVASALDYLHNQCQSPIIHCDLKPSNVLLDADMVGHIGDFGLAKIVLESTFDTRANMSSVGLRGTVGYVAPEYANGSEVSKEGDVYSYGILLLEMFTGLNPTSDIFRDNLNLHNYVAEALPEQAIAITDPVLLHQGERHDSSHDSLSERNCIFQKCLETVYRIGLACSVEEPSGRMNIDKVAAQLHLIRKKLFAARLLE
ncbi:hypothetical protein BT93_F0607 [Corymbia citriodora subsp. variegata]|nr:hypothetical protein BT93_F0607 [Corymbia citriodora subsp. variegata]